ncbi:unnamed protein product [Boreogadus saida]
MWIGHRSKRPSYTSSQSESWLVYCEVVTTVTLAGLIIVNRMSCSVDLNILSLCPFCLLKKHNSAVQNIRP